MSGESFLEFIKENCGTGEILKFVYKGGHSSAERRGTFVSLDGNLVRVLHSGDETKTYRVTRLA